MNYGGSLKQLCYLDSPACPWLPPTNPGIRVRVSTGGYDDLPDQHRWSALCRVRAPPALTEARLLCLACAAAAWFSVAWLFHTSVVIDELAKGYNLSLDGELMMLDRNLGSVIPIPESEVHTL